MNEPREREVLIAGGATVAEAGDQRTAVLRVAPPETQYGGLKTDHTKRFKELERENAQIKKLLAELNLDNRMLQDVAPSPEPAATMSGVAGWSYAPRSSPTSNTASMSAP